MVSTCCIFIDGDPYNQALFNSAMHEIAPDAICFNVSNSNDAMQIISFEGIEPEYVFLEFDAHEHESLEFLVAMRSKPEFHHTQIIVHATSPPPHLVLKLKESGASAIYYKPYAYPDIMNMLSLYLSTGAAAMRPN